MSSLVLRTALLLGLSLATACADDLAQEGEACSTSAECGAGLLCDNTQEPAICAKTGGPRPDLAGVDQSAPPGDLATDD